MRPFRCAAWLRFAMLFAALATLLASCAAPSLPPLPWQTDGALPDAQQVLHVAAGSYSVKSLDPGNEQYAAGSPAQAQMLSLLYSGLFTFDARLHPVPALVSRYTVSADGLRYTFHLRPNARFAEGTPLTSADAAFSLNRLLTDCARRIWLGIRLTSGRCEAGANPV